MATGHQRAKEVAVAVDTQDLQLKLIRRSAGVELDLLPLQGLWTEEQYLKLTDQSNHLIEFTDGYIEVLPMPTKTHQLIARFLFLALNQFIDPLGGLVLFAALRMQVRSGKQREPDLLLVLDKHDTRAQEAFWLGADLVVEIVSPDNPERDTVEKVADYAEAQIPEYWIVNPLDDTITVLTLDGVAYATHGVFERGATATSRLLDGFALSVDAVFDAQ
jgi:Uma2 family endonuclease